MVYLKPVKDFGYRKHALVMLWSVLLPATQAYGASSKRVSHQQREENYAVSGKEAVLETCLCGYFSCVFRSVGVSHV